MKLHGRIPVEQLDEERLTNIERKLVVAVSDLRAPAERAPRRLLAFAAVAMAALAAGLFGYKLRGDGTQPPPAEVPQQIAINTDTGHTVDLGDAQLTSGPGTNLVVERTRARVVVRMMRGSIDMHVEHDPSRVLVVLAGDTEIEDIGTRFTVDYDGESHVAVRVTEGEVLVKRAGKHVEVAAGFAWTVELGKLTIEALEQHTIAAATAIAAVTPPETPAGSTPPTVTERTSSLTPRVVQPTVAGTSAANTPRTTTAQTRKAPRSNARLALERLPIEEPLDVGTRDLNTAIAKYLDLAVSMADGQDKTQLLYSMAVMQHRAKQDKAALYTLSGVIKRQGGKAYKAALWLNVRIECMQRFDDECRQAADLYLRKVPDGVAAGVAQEIVNEIARGR
jgi:hypothetical protein